LKCRIGRSFNFQKLPDLQLFGARLSQPQRVAAARPLKFSTSGSIFRALRLGQLRSFQIRLHV
jgi:hypothetical protein